MNGKGENNNQQVQKLHLKNSMNSATASGSTRRQSNSANVSLAN
jgi:hypothetical protein